MTLAESRRRRYIQARRNRESENVTPAQSAAVTAWLRSTATSGNIASLADMLSSNAATATGSNRPLATTLNGQPAISFDGSDDRFTWTVSAANASTPRWGFAFWVKLGSVSGLHTILGGEITPTTTLDASRIFLATSGTDLIVDIYTSTGVSRRGTASGILSTAAAHFLSVEYDGGQSTEADRFTIWLDNVKQSVSFSNSAGTPPGSTMPATLVAPTSGAFAIGVQRFSDNLRPLSAVTAGNLYNLGGAGGISGGGLLVSRGREILMNFERPA